MIALTLFDRRYPLSLLVWSIAALSYELSQLNSTVLKERQTILKKLKQYFAVDPFNIIDVPALTMVVVSIICQLSAEGESEVKEIKENLGPALDGVLDYLAHSILPIIHLVRAVQLEVWHQNLAALALLLMWLRQLRLLSLMSPDVMAPLVLMVLAMLKDVTKFVTILIPVLLGFVAAITKLYAGEASKGGYSAECQDSIEALNSFGSTLQIFFEGALLGDAPLLECIHDSSHPFAGLTLMYAFLILTVLLLLNMIIAMMGKTFDSVWDSAQEQSSMQFARSVFGWELEKSMPAPLNILVLPLKLLLMKRQLLVTIVRAIFKLFASDTSEAIKEESSASHDKLVLRVNNILVQGEQRTEKSKNDSEPDADAEKEQKLLDESFGSLQDLSKLQDNIEDALLTKFGQWDSTNDMIKHAILVLSDKIDSMKKPPSRRSSIHKRSY